MRIGELAKQGEVSVQTIRFYERCGLMPVPRRRESGYRIYGLPDLRRLRSIVQAKKLGFTLDEIGSVLRMRERGACPCGEVIKTAERHLHRAERQIRDLENFRVGLAKTLKQWKRSGQRNVSGSAICHLIERTIAK